MNSIETLDVTTVPAFTIQYTGTGKLTHASHTITCARTAVNAFTLTYTGSAATCTVAQDADTLTIARTVEPAIALTYIGTAATCTATIAANTLTLKRTVEPAIVLTYIGTAATCTAAIAANTLTLARTAEDAFTLTYTGANPTATVKVVGTTLTYDIGAGDVALDLTNESYNTIAKVVTALHAVEGLTCTLATGAINTNAGNTLNALSVTSIKTALNLKYTPADLTYDLTNGSYDAISEVVSTLDGLDLYTCTLATGAIDTNVSTTLNTLTATSIKTALTLTYTPADLTYDLTNGSYDTIAKVVTTLDALDLYTCTLISGAINTNASTTLNNKTATSIKTVLNLTYTPADLTWDLTNASYNAMSEIIAALHALTNYTCTIATGAVATDASALLDTLEAASIKVAKTLTYSYADVTLDTTNASYNTVTEVRAALDALNGVECSNITTTFLTADAITINEFGETDFSTAMGITIESGEATAAFMPLGAEIRVEGTQYLAIYATVDINSSNDIRLKATARLESGGTDYVIDHSQILYSRDSVATDKSYIKVANDEDQYLMWLIPVYGYAYIQLWLSAGTVGETAGQIDKLEYQNIKGVPL
jgi:hypothetical protein